MTVHALLTDKSSESGVHLPLQVVTGAAAHTHVGDEKFDIIVHLFTREGGEDDRRYRYQKNL